VVKRLDDCSLIVLGAMLDMRERMDSMVVRCSINGSET